MKLYGNAPHKEHKYQGDIGFVSLISTAAAHAPPYIYWQRHHSKRHTEKYPHAII
jgi:hypothetical protein